MRTGSDEQLQLQQQALAQIGANRRMTIAGKVVDNAVSQATKINWHQGHQGYADKKRQVDDSDTEEAKRSKLLQRETSWEYQYAALLEYGKVHGTYNVEFTDPLFAWLTSQRKLKRIGRLRQDRQMRLQILEDEGKFSWNSPEGFGFDDPAVDRPLPSWDLFFDTVLLYGEENGDCNVPQGFIVYIDDTRYDLGAWVQHQRALVIDGQLPDSLKQFFDILHSENRFLWEIPNGYTVPLINLHNNHNIWTSKFDAVKAYAELNGHCNIDDVGTKLALPDGSQFDAALWIRAQRRRRIVERLPVEYQKKLDLLYIQGLFLWVSSVDMITIETERQKKEIMDEQIWCAWYNVLYWLSRQNGHCNLGSADTVELPDGSEAEIGKWLTYQRMSMKALTLRLDRADRLIDLVDEGKLAASDWQEISKPYRDRRGLVAAASAVLDTVDGTAPAISLSG